MKIDKKDIFIMGNKIYLKVLTKQDVLTSGWYGWFNNEQTCELLQQRYFPNTLESQLEFWNELSLKTNKSKIQLGICKKQTNKILGVISLSNINTINQTAENSILIGEAEGKNAQIATEAMRLLFWHGFNVLNLNKIYGGSISKLVVEFICKVASGSKEGVRKKQIYKNGIFVDAYLWGVMKDRFNKEYFNFLKK
jgi:[ribosomal protein S5]-alanine N-acetyltransferase